MAGEIVAVVVGAVASILNASETRPELATRASAVAPDACATASAGVNVTPLPVAPAVPTVVIVTVSGFAPVESIVIVLPTKRPATLATFTFVAPAAAAAASVVEVLTVTPHDLLYVPSVETVSSTQPFFVAVWGADRREARPGERDRAPVPAVLAVRARRRDRCAR